MVDENISQQGERAAGIGTCDCSVVQRDGDVLRCECGNLMARCVGGRIELKCRRCKRTVMLPTTIALEAIPSR